MVLGVWDCADPHRDWGPLEPVPRHELVIPVRGCLARERNGEVVTATPNVALLANARDAYRFRHPDGTPDRCALVILGVGAMEDLARATGSNRIGFHDPCVPVPADLFLAFGTLVSRLRGGADPGDVRVGETVGALLTLGAGGSRPRTPPARSTADARRHRRAVDTAIEFMAARYRERLTLDRVAREASYSPFHFARTFRRHTGLSVHGFLTGLRLRAAVDLLLDGDEDLGRIALRLGFSSHSHFAAAFRREYGTPPSMVRGLGRSARPRQTGQGPGPRR